MRFDREKFKRLLHYVSWKAGKRDWFGATKLYKVLWFADARQYTLTGSSITGETYIREKFGPIPKHGIEIRRELRREYITTEYPNVRNDGDVTRIVSEVTPDLSIFTTEELQIVDWWIEHIDKNHTAKSISDRSHDYVWEIAKMGEELPYFALRVSRIQEPEDGDLVRLKQRAKDLGLE